MFEPPMNWWRFLFLFKGRISRKEYRRYLIGFILFLGIVYGFIQVFQMLISVCQLISFLASYTMFPVSVKRLHDLNFAGGFVILMLTPLIVAIFIHSTSGYIICSLITMFFGGFVCWMVEGTVGPNDYGESPRYRIWGV